MRRITIITVVLGALFAVLPASAEEEVRYLDPVFVDVSITEGIVYGSAMNSRDEPQELLLDLYEPVGDETLARPAIVFAHGGGFTGGSRTEESIVELARAFAHRGYVTASISYRVRPDLGYEELIVGSLLGEMPGAMHDAQYDMQAAVRFLRFHADTYRIDPALIAAGGISAGASMALETAYNPEDPGSSNDLEVSSAIAAAVSSSGATDPRRIEMGRPPVVMFHGTHDTTAPYPTAIMACGTATALGNVCDLHTYPGDGHNLRPRVEEILAVSARFLCDHMLGGCAA